MKLSRFVDIDYTLPFHAIQIESGGIASMDGRIQDGDQIVEINDVQVISRDQVGSQ